jgi:hypothetical protein
VLRVATARRWTAEERDERLAAAPAFRFASPSAEQLAELIRRYEEITGDSVHRQAKRNLVATCYRVHGDDTLAFIADEFARSGTPTNLLGTIRTSRPRAHSLMDRDRRLGHIGDAEAQQSGRLVDEVGELLDEQKDQAHRGDRLDARADITAECGRSYPTSRPTSTVDPSPDLVPRACAQEQPAQHGFPFDTGLVDVQSTRDSVAPMGRPPMQPDTEIVPTSVIAGGGVTITCADYRAHQLRHRRVGSRFLCDVCEAVPS